MASDNIKTNQAPPADSPPQAPTGLDPKRLARRSLVVQAFAAAAGTIGGLTGGLAIGLAVLAGGLASLLPAGIFTLLIQRIRTDGSDPQGFLRWYFTAEAVKVACSIALLILAFRLAGLNAAGVLAGFLATLAAGWVGLVIASLRRSRNGA